MCVCVYFVSAHVCMCACACACACAWYLPMCVCLRVCAHGICRLKARRTPSGKAAWMPRVFTSRVSRSVSTHHRPPAPTAFCQHLLLLRGWDTQGYSRNPFADTTTSPVLFSNARTRKPAAEGQWRSFILARFFREEGVNVDERTRPSSFPSLHHSVSVLLLRFDCDIFVVCRY